MKQDILAKRNVHVTKGRLLAWGVGVAVILTTILAWPMASQAASKPEAPCAAVQPCSAGCVCPSQL